MGGGLCQNCPAGYSSIAQSSFCSKCNAGQASASGGECIDLCPDGMMYSRSFDVCQICPEDTFSRSGDITCTACPPNHYSPKQSAICFPSDRVGGILRLDADFDDFSVADFKREIAIMLDTEPQYIEVLLTRAGSVIVYFDILDPTSIDSDDSDIRQLSGNEKMLLLYQWWLTNDERMQDLQESVIDFKVYTIQLEGSGSNLTDDVITLFISDDTKKPLLPQEPEDFDDADNSVSNDYRKSTFYFTLSVNDVGSASTLVSSLTLLISLLFLFF